MLGKSVIVTGAGSGIGRAVVQECASRGARVAALDRDGEAASSVAAHAAASGAAATIGIECDVASEASVRTAFDQVVDTFGSFDSVLANAGIEVNAPLHTFDPAQWRRVLEVNLTGVFLTCREAVRGLLRGGLRGSIVCTSSPSAFVGFAGGGNSAYAASKGGISAFVRSAALDYAAAGIRVNAVVPGATDTPMLLAGVPEPARPAELHRIRDAARQQIPLGRLADPAEIAAAVTWLLSDASSYVTGTHLVCDGGLLAKSANTF